MTSFSSWAKTPPSHESSVESSLLLILWLSYLLLILGLGHFLLLGIQLLLNEVRCLDILQLWRSHWGLGVLRSQHKLRLWCNLRLWLQWNKLNLWRWHILDLRWRLYHLWLQLLHHARIFTFYKIRIICPLLKLIISSTILILMPN